MKLASALAVVFAFVQFISNGQSTREQNNPVKVTADFRMTDCEENMNRLYELLNAKDQEIKRSREQANDLIKALVNLKQHTNPQNNAAQNNWTGQSDERTVKLIDHIASERKQNYHVSKQYIRGPRGGCYYINSNGNKTYVDRSFCN
ncbi:MAG: hypothetical protein J7619_12510 [Dyadobacter sp.]|uniref:hypothetical protein n=1 Tax=Dyadobacter sp. TaxID=1914288 RepID=UPI001B1D17A6|nr:hypothetical protein [Dyadobacter sp.]MBO9613516.1 hypothetical protein [Dyadobacter sp.]